MICFSLCGRSSVIYTQIVNEGSQSLLGRSYKVIILKWKYQDIFFLPAILTPADLDRKVSLSLTLPKNHLFRLKLLMRCYRMKML